MFFPRLGHGANFQKSVYFHTLVSWLQSAQPSFVTRPMSYCVPTTCNISSSGIDWLISRGFHIWYCKHNLRKCLVCKSANLNYAPSAFLRLATPPPLISANRAHENNRDLKSPANTSELKSRQKRLHPASNFHLTSGKAARALPSEAVGHQNEN